ncbi:MAG: hypothetical protein FWC59_01985, partial [Actinomycetia bacterium]|nr:hypothetical protein [Actinomycetes bacterium]
MKALVGGLSTDKPGFPSCKFNEFSSRSRRLALLGWGFLTALILMLWLVCFPAVAYAAGSGGDANSSTSDNSATTATTLSANDGSATIVEQTTASNPDSNEVNQMLAGGETTDNLTFKNDLPSYTQVVTTDTDTNKTISTETYLTDSGQAVNLPEGTKTPTDAQVTQSAPIGNEQITTTVTNSTNAIQKAVNKTLTSLSADSTSVTISVKTGDYDGNINIDSSAATSFSDWQNFILYLIAEDALPAPGSDGLIDHSTLDSSSQGLVNINGNLYVNGVRVILVGFNFSLNSQITVADSNTDIYGTVKDDTITVVLDQNGGVVVHGGAGNDTLSVSSRVSNGGSQSTTAAVQLNGDAGDDTITMDATVANSVAAVVVDGGVGHNRLHLTGSLAANAAGSTAEIIAGNPAITLKNSDGQS